MVVVLFFAALSALVWGRTLGNKFVWDDEYFIVSNPAIRSGLAIPSYFTDISTMAGMGMAGTFAIFRPLRNISYLLDFQIAGLDPRWWHAHNVILHTVNALLLALVARRLLKGAWAPVFAGAVFLLHPVQTEAVAWVKCRDDLLMTLFVLLAVLVWLRWRRSALTLGKLAALTLLYIAACLSKIQAIILPALLLAMEYWTGEPGASGVTTRRRAWRTTGWLILVGAAVAAWRHVYIGHSAQSGYMAGMLAPTLLTMTRAGVEYLRLLVLPIHLLADYSGMDASHSWTDPRVLVSSAILFLIAVTVLAGRRRFAVESFGLLWVAICLLPVSNVVAMLQYMAERFLYLPLAGFALTLAALMDRLERRSAPTALVFGGLLLAIYGALASGRAAVWKNSETLYAATVRDAPRAVRPRRNLLAHWMNSGNYDKALPIVRELQASALEDLHAEARHKAEYTRHLGFILVQTGRESDGVKLLRAAIELDSSYSQPCVDLGLVEGKAGRHKTALEWFDRAATISPDDSSAHYNRGVSLRELGRMADAEAAFRKAIVCVPDNPGPYKSLAAVLWSRRQFVEAAAVYRDALRIWPWDQELRYWFDQASATIRNRRSNRAIPSGRR
jgi:tetratricopeptide (TPR) repeat protein